MDKKLGQVEALVNSIEGKVLGMKLLVLLRKVWSGEQPCLIFQLVTLLQEQSGYNYKICV